ncbi:uncharacterized protein E0L32_012021 [Thyridium curvatum]|uniref:Uncharacterized protein n=1 Tax=Thyridium curvatum TaxID=1093900 RepID=A0A507BG03_9PEZI|nr:uncharacterized protein E0L32_012021 [Thyridium curvatum]TPX17694.1 hypothetical protein E0L32_012021 [Thyridium curvatum]
MQFLKGEDENPTSQDPYCGLERKDFVAIESVDTWRSSEHFTTGHAPTHNDICAHEFFFVLQLTRTGVRKNLLYVNVFIEEESMPDGGKPNQGPPPSSSRTTRPTASPGTGVPGPYATDLDITSTAFESDLAKAHIPAPIDSSHQAQVRRSAPQSPTGERSGRPGSPLFSSPPPVVISRPGSPNLPSGHDLLGTPPVNAHGTRDASDCRSLNTSVTGRFDSPISRPASSHGYARRTTTARTTAERPTSWYGGSLTVPPETAGAQTVSRPNLSRSSASYDHTSRGSGALGRPVSTPILDAFNMRFPRRQELSVLDRPVSMQDMGAIADEYRIPDTSHLRHVAHGGHGARESMPISQPQPPHSMAGLPQAAPSPFLPHQDILVTLQSRPVTPEIPILAVPAAISRETSYGQLPARPLSSQSHKGHIQNVTNPASFSAVKDPKIPLRVDTSYKHNDSSNGTHHGYSKSASNIPSRPRSWYGPQDSRRSFEMSPLALRSENASSIDLAAPSTRSQTPSGTRKFRAVPFQPDENYRQPSRPSTPGSPYARSATHSPRPSMTRPRSSIELLARELPYQSGTSTAANTTSTTSTPGGSRSVPVSLHHALPQEDYYPARPHYTDTTPTPSQSRRGSIQTPLNDSGRSTPTPPVQSAYDRSLAAIAVPYQPPELMDSQKPGIPPVRPADRDREVVNTKNGCCGMCNVSSLAACGGVVGGWVGTFITIFTVGTLAGSIAGYSKIYEEPMATESLVSHGWKR